MIITQRILNARPHGFVSATVVGTRSVGKTVYTLKVAAELYMELYGLDIDAAYEKAIDSTVFTIEDVVNMLEKHDFNNKADIVIWDDAGIYASGLMYHTNVTLFALLKGMTDSLRTCTNVMLMSTPTQSGLIGFLKSYDEFLIKIIKASNGGYNRIAKAYKWMTLPSGTRRIYRQWEDNFNCYMPKRHYSRYAEIRNKEKDKMVKMLRERLDKKKDKKLGELYGNITDQPISGK